MQYLETHRRIETDVSPSISEIRLSIIISKPLQVTVSPVDAVNVPEPPSGAFAGSVTTAGVSPSLMENDMDPEGDVITVHTSSPGAKFSFIAV